MEGTAVDTNEHKENNTYNKVSFFKNLPELPTAQTLLSSVTDLKIYKF